MNMRLSRISCKDCPIRHRAVCAECNDAELATLEQIKTYVTYRKGQSIAMVGQPLEYLSSVVSGCATLSRTMEDGRRQIVGLLLPSDFVGRPGRLAVSFDIEAVSDVTLCRFERKTFERIVRTSPNVAGRLLSMTMDELEVARDWQVLLGRATARERLAHFLLSLVRREPDGEGGSLHVGSATLELPISRRQIADLTGLTIETTSRQFTALKQEGLVETVSSRHIHLPDLERLRSHTTGEGGDLQR